MRNVTDISGSVIRVPDSAGAAATFSLIDALDEDSRNCLLAFLSYVERNRGSKQPVQLMPENIPNQGASSTGGIVAPVDLGHLTQER